MDLFKVIMTLPLVWKLIAVFLLVIGNITYLFRKQFIKLIHKIFKKNNINLTEHSLFAEVSFIKHKMKRIDVGHDKKNKIFRQLLLIKFDSIISFSNDLIIKKDLDKLSNSQFYAIIIKNMTDIVEDYNNKIKLEFGEDIFKLVMLDQDKGFNNVHEKTIEFIKGNIERSLKTDHVVFVTVEDKLDFLFDMYYVAIKIAMTDVDKIYKNFNGDLDKLIKNDNKFR